MSNDVYTVGTKTLYDVRLKVHKKLGTKFQKLGRTADYPGGFALNTIEDARNLIVEMKKEGTWGVYRLDASWKKDTVPSENGWWHALINSSNLIEKIE